MDETASPSMLSMLGAMLYLAVSASCAVAGLRARSIGVTPQHVRFWVAVCALFLVLAAMRAFAVEDLLRNGMREALQGWGLSESRRMIQAPIALVVLALGLVTVNAVRRRAVAQAKLAGDVAIHWARLAVIGMIALVALRITSLHAVDVLLFTRWAGPVTLNRVLDTALAVGVMVSAAKYLRVHRRSGG